MTQRVALIGRPLKRRHSAVMHNAAFAAAGIDASYDLLEIEPDAVAGAVADARGADFLGLGVTAPYKRVIAALCDGVVLVIQVGRTAHDLLRRVVDQIEAVKGRILGVLLNRADPRQDGYYYAYETYQRYAGVDAGGAQH